MKARAIICTIMGGLGAVISFFIGDFDNWMRLLLIAMAVDWVLGVIVAYKGKSNKTLNGSLSSAAGLKGLVKKAAVLLLVGVTYQVEIASGSNGIRNIAVIGFSANEVLSILENVAALGVVIPDKLREALEIFKTNGGER